MRASRGVDVDGGSLQAPRYRFSHNRRDTCDSSAVTSLSKSLSATGLVVPFSSTFCRKVWTAYLSWKATRIKCGLETKTLHPIFCLEFLTIARP